MSALSLLMLAAAVVSTLGAIVYVAWAIGYAKGFENGIRRATDVRFGHFPK